MEAYPEGAPFSDALTSYISAVITDPDSAGLFAQICYYLSLVPPDVGHNSFELRQLMDREHSNITARLRQMELRGLVKKIDVWRPSETGEDSQCYTLGDGIPPDIEIHVPKHNIDWPTKPLGPLDWDILHALPETDANTAIQIERTEQAVSGNRRHLVQRGLVCMVGIELNLRTNRPNKVWGLTIHGRALLANEPVHCGLFGYVNLRRFECS